MIKRTLSGLRRDYRTVLAWAGECSALKGYFRDSRGGRVTMAIRKPLLPDPVEAGKLAVKFKTLLEG